MTINIDENISLELINASHAQAIFDIANDSRDYLREWLIWVDEMQSVEFIENYIKESAQRKSDGSAFAFVIIDNEKVVGRIGIYKINNINKTSMHKLSCHQNNHPPDYIYMAQLKF